MTRIMIISLLFVIFNAQSVHSAGPTDFIDFTKYNPQGIDVTSEYTKEFSETHQVAPQLQGVKIMLIEGIMANYVNFMGNLIMKKFGTFTYFDAQIDFFKSVGIDFVRVKLETENSSVKNALVIAKAIAQETKPILLFTHSKGGVDALMALVNQPTLLKKIKGIINIQTPYLGTPVSDYLHETQPWKTIADITLAMMGGSGESLKDLSTRQRVPWYNSNKAVIMSIQKQIPILSFAAHKLPVPGKDDSMFKFSRDLMYNKMGVESDGLVPWKSAILPGGPYIVVEGMDHATAVSKTKFIQLDQLKFTRAILAVYLKIKPVRKLAE